MTDLLINSYREIIIFISAIGVFVIVLIIFILLINPGKKPKIKDDEYKDIYIETSGYDSQDLLISPNDFIMPVIKSFDLTNDYVEFLPTRRFQLPEMKIVVKDYNKILEDTIEDSCKFNFEKRKELRMRKK